MTTEIIIAGFGGQGVLFAGKLIASSSMKDGKNISWLPSYGPEMRGGTANCHVVISTEPVASPMIVTPNVLIAFNAPSLAKFKDTLANPGVIFYDSSLIEETIENGFGIPTTKMALSMDAKSLANVIMVGYLCKKTGFVSYNVLEQTLKDNTPKSKPQLLEGNLSALKMGYDF